MGLLKRAAVVGQFRLGIYKARQIIRIERGGLVISNCDSRYQPGLGIRYELSPDDWFLHVYEFFPRDEMHSQDDDAFLSRDVYYDFYSKDAGYKAIYAIFKNNHDTGYRLIRTRSSDQGDYYSVGTRSGYFNRGVHINQFGISNYEGSCYGWAFTEEGGVVEAAAMMLSDSENFTKTTLDLTELTKDCDASPGSCLLHKKLEQLLSGCKFRQEYLKSY